MLRTRSSLHRQNRVSPSLARPSEAQNNQRTANIMALYNQYQLTSFEYRMKVYLEPLVENRYGQLTALSSPQHERPHEPQMEPQITEPRGSQREALAYATPEGKGIQQRSSAPSPVRVLKRPSNNESSDSKEPFMQSKELRGSQSEPHTPTPPEGRSTRQRPLVPGTVRILHRPSKGESHDLKPFMPPKEDVAKRATQRDIQQPEQRPRGSQREALAYTTSEDNGVQQQSLLSGAMRILQRPSKKESSADLKKPIMQPVEDVAKQATRQFSQQSSQQAQQQPATMSQQYPLPARSAIGCSPVAEALRAVRARAARQASAAPPDPDPAANLSFLSPPARPARPAFELPPHPAISQPQLSSSTAAPAAHTAPTAAPTPAKTTTLRITYNNESVLVPKPPTLTALKHLVVGLCGVDLADNDLSMVRAYMPMPYPINFWDIEEGMPESVYEVVGNGLALWFGLFEWVVEVGPGSSQGRGDAGGGGGSAGRPFFGCFNGL